MLLYFYDHRATGFNVGYVTMSTQECAALIRAEGRLGTGSYCDADGLRCAIGVLEGWPEGHRRLTGASSDDLQQALGGVRFMALNENFQGTPEQRAAHVAAKLDAMTNKGDVDG